MMRIILIKNKIKFYQINKFKQSKYQQTLLNVHFHMLIHQFVKIINIQIVILIAHLKQFKNMKNYQYMAHKKFKALVSCKKTIIQMIQATEFRQPTQIYQEKIKNFIR